MRARALAALGAVLLGASLLGLAGASAQPAPSWNLAAQVPPGKTVTAAQAGDLRVHFRNDGGTTLAGVEADRTRDQPLAELGAGQSLVAWVAPLPSGGQEIVGAARSDVATVIASFADGTTALLTLDALNAFASVDAHEQLVGLQGLDATGATIAEISVPPTGPSCAQTVCRVLTTGRPASTPQAPVYGLFSVPGRAGRGIVSYGGRTVLGRVDPTTLKPVGKTIAVPSLQPQAFSPDGTHLLGTATSTSTRLTIIDLRTLTANPSLQARLLADLGPRTIRAAAWPATNRILVLAQSYSKPYNRNVASRTLFGIDPRTGAVRWRRTLTRKLGLLGAQSVGGKFVLQLGDSSLRRTRETIVVVSPDGRLRSSTIDIPRVNSRFQEGRLVTTTGPAPAAYIVSADGTVFALDLDTAHATAHVVDPPADAPTDAPAASSNILTGGALGDNIVAGSLFARADGKPRKGVYLIDTRTWTARLVDRVANRFTTSGDTLITYTAAPFTAIISGRSGHGRRPLFGTGITIYDEHGTRLHHLFGRRAFIAAGLTPRLAYGYAVFPALIRSKRRLPPNVVELGTRVLFNPTTGKSLGARAGASVGTVRLISPTTPLGSG
jgi:hypothetical protein